MSVFVVACDVGHFHVYRFETQMAASCALNVVSLWKVDVQVHRLFIAFCVPACVLAKQTSSASVLRGFLPSACQHTRALPPFCEVRIISLKKGVRYFDCYGCVCDVFMNAGCPGEL